MQIKTTMKYHFTRVKSKWPSSKDLQIVNAREDVEKRERSCIVGGNVNWYSHYGEQHGDSLKTKNRAVIWSSNPTSRYISGENHYSKTSMHPNIHSSSVEYPGHESNQNIHWQMNGWRRCVIYAKWNTQFSSVTHLCPTLCDPMNCGMPGLPVQCQVPEPTQIHVHWIGDATQPSHPLSSPSPPALNLSQNQSLFKWVSSLHQVAKVLEFQL